MREHSGRNVVVVGAGAVGATFAYALMLDGAAEEIVLVDHNQDLVRGQVIHADELYGHFHCQAGVVRVEDARHAAFTQRFKDMVAADCDA